MDSHILKDNDNDVLSLLHFDLFWCFWITPPVLHGRLLQSLHYSPPLLLLLSVFEETSMGGTIKIHFLSDISDIQIHKSDIRYVYSTCKRERHTKKIVTHKESDTQKEWHAKKVATRKKIATHIKESDPQKGERHWNGVLSNLAPIL